MRGLRSKQELEHDQHEEQQCGPLDDARKPFTAHQSVDGFDLQQVAARKDISILWFEFGCHISYSLPEWIVS